jgi:Zn-finger protein
LPEGFSGKALNTSWYSVALRHLENLAMSYETLCSFRRCKFDVTTLLKDYCGLYPCGIGHAWRDNHIVKFCNKYLLLQNEYTNELLKKLKHAFSFPICCAFINRCLVALRTMGITPLLCCLLGISLSLYLPLYNLGSDLTENSSIIQKWTSTVFTYWCRLYLAPGCLPKVCLRGKMFTEPLLSNGCFLVCDWRLACRRYVVARLRANQGMLELP